MKKFNKMKNINKIELPIPQFWNKKKKNLKKLQQKLSVVKNTYKLCKSAFFVRFLCIAYSVRQFSYPIKYEKFAFIPFYLAVHSRCLFCFCYFVFIIGQSCPSKTIMQAGLDVFLLLHCSSNSAVHILCTKLYAISL